MKVITAYGARFYGYRSESRKLEWLAVLLYAVGAGLWFVANGRYFPETPAAVRERFALIAAGSGLLSLANCLEFVNVLGKYVTDRRSAVPAGQSRAEAVAIVCMILGGLGTSMASLLSMNSDEGEVRARQLYDASFFYVAGSVVNSIFLSNKVGEETGIHRGPQDVMTKAMTTLQLLASTFYACGTLLHVTTSSESCKTGFVVGSYFTFVSTALIFTSAFLNYFRTRILHNLTSEAQMGSRSASSSRKKKKSSSRKTAENSTLASRFAGWFGGPREVVDEGDEEEGLIESTPSTRPKKSKTKSRG
mmetsp:Transcript_18692/g.45962  ORF Transcript_18692/g.45962 Transcript_18692/m.45962 type:complete len:305 (-) Transcript_18692:194-1108(-)